MNTPVTVWPEWRPFPSRPWVLTDVETGHAWRPATTPWGHMPPRFNTPEQAIAYAKRRGLIVSMTATTIREG